MKTRLGLVVAICGFAGVARADQPSRTIGLGEVYRLADQQSFGARRARGRADIGRGFANEAKWRLLPALSIVVGLSKVDGATQSSSTGEFDQATYTTANPYTRVSYGANPLETYYGYRGATLAADALDAGVKVAQRDVRAAATAHYFELALATAKLAVADKALADAKEVLRITEVLERQGVGKGDELARAKAGVAQAEQNQIRARRGVDQASIRLTTLLDLDVATPLAPDPRDLEVATAPAVLDAPSLAKGALARRPELVELSSRTDARRAERSAAWSSLLAPTVEVYYLEGGLGAGYGSLADRRAYGALLTWTVSATKIARVSTAGAQIRETELERDELRQRITAEVAAASADVRRAAERLAPADRALAAAEDAFRIVSVRFRNGNAILVEVIAAQREVELARLDRVSAVVEHNLARARLQIVLGQ